MYEVSMIDGHIDEPKMTDEQIVKALKKALTDVDAPIGEHWCCGFLTTKNIKDALDLINRQKAEIEKTKAILESIENDFYPLPFEMDFDKVIKNAKAEAYKEFAERLKEQMYIKKDRVFYSEKIDDLLKEMVGTDFAQMFMGVKKLEPIPNNEKELVGDDK